MTRFFYIVAIQLVVRFFVPSGHATPLGAFLKNMDQTTSALNSIQSTVLKQVKTLEGQAKRGVTNVNGELWSNLVQDLSEMEPRVLQVDGEIKKIEAEFVKAASYSRATDRIKSIRFVFNGVDGSLSKIGRPLVPQTKIADVLAELNNLRFLLADVTGNLILSLGDSFEYEPEGGAHLPEGLARLSMAVAARKHKINYRKLARVFRTGANAIVNAAPGMGGARMITYVEGSTSVVIHEFGPSGLASHRALAEEKGLMRDLIAKVIFLEESWGFSYTVNSCSHRLADQ